MAKEFLGTGWRFPVQLNEQQEIAMSSHEQDVQEAIWLILSTAPGERIMLPEFGCGIHDFVFAPNNTRTAGLIAYHVELALNRWEPRIDLMGVDVRQDQANLSLLLIEIEYRVRTTDSRFNLVYPFYLERGETA